MHLLSWETFAPALDRAHPSSFNFGGTRAVIVGYDPRSTKLFLRIPLTTMPESLESRYAGITLEAVVVEGKRYLEVATSIPERFSDTFRLLALITEVFEEEGTTPVGAFLRAAARWDAVLASRGLMSREAEVGLVGELLFLRALHGRLGPSAVARWTGRGEHGPDRHDFRLPEVDVEVKATTRRKRIHRIHGLTQLAPNPTRPLYLLSLQLAGSSPTGESMTSLIGEMRERLNGEGAPASAFEDILRVAGYADGDAANYSGQWILASEPMLIHVDQGCPRLTPGIVEQVLPPALVGRFEEVAYMINVDGLGVSPHDASFVSTLGFSSM